MVAFSNRPQLNCILTGLATTALCTVWFFLIDTDRLLELQLLNWRLQDCSTVRPDPRIVHVDIDDATIDRVGRWPWPRRDIADLVRAISEFSPQSLAIDLLLDDPQTPRRDDPRASPFALVEPTPRLEGEPSPDAWILDDLELADAIARAGNVVLSVHMRITGPNKSDPPEVRLDAWRRTDPALTVDDALRRLGRPDTLEERDRVARALLRLDVRDLLRGDFTLSDRDIARRLGAGLDDVRAVVAGVKRDVAGELVAAHALGDDPKAVERDIRRAILGDRAETLNADRRDVMEAVLTQTGVHALRGGLPGAPAEARDAVYRAHAAEPPLYVFTRAARGVGAVNLTADPDGQVRRVPPLVEWDGRLVKHLGLEVACRLLGVSDDAITIRRDAVEFPDPAGGPPYVIPLDRAGHMLIHWTRDAESWRTGGDMPHVSAAKLWSIVDARRAMRHNEIAANLRLAEVVSIVKRGADAEYRSAVRELNDLERETHDAGLKRDRSADELRGMESRIAELRETVRREHRSAESFVDVTAAEVREELTEEEIAADAEARDFIRAERILKTDVAALRSANEQLARTVAELRAELAERLNGRVIFLGFAATATGDIVPTPIDPSTNGVMCHAHVLNTILQRRFIGTPTDWTQALLVLLLGAGVTIVTSTAGPRLSFIVTLGAIAVFTAVNAWVLFLRRDLWVVLAAATVTLFVAWAIVTMFRQLVAEREKRFFAKQLAQYTAPAIAARIAESPQAVRAFKTVQTRDITCIFTDLAGFTGITEQEDAEIVQYVLNTYLERMSRVIWSHRGLINKFMGDGIMAFFNASVDPQPDHARLACDVALDTIVELDRLKQEHRNRPAGRVFQRLDARAGLASGACKNGDFGSELKADYTIIGDSVNLAARLEPANKVFGTRIMIPESTRAVVSGLYEFRYLAELQVKGKARTVPVFEIVCRKGQLTTEQAEYVERFEQGVALYKERRWDECIVHFSRILARRPADAGSARYIDACQELKSFPPEDGWAGVLELKEK